MGFIIWIRAFRFAFNAWGFVASGLGLGFRLSFSRFGIRGLQVYFKACGATQKLEDKGFRFRVKGFRFEAFRFGV